MQTETAYHGSFQLKHYRHFQQIEIPINQPIDVQIDRSKNSQWVRQNQKQAEIRLSYIL